ncbi:MAG: heavy-metal-associated domain-containing protein [Anaerolineaceae bacterium]|nr:heavy-metal-associated domain-containing protein [Anaerolineaceae bacterium]
MSRVTYTIPGISCNHCVHTIKTELEDLKGVQKVEADVNIKKVTIDYEPPATEDAIVSTLKDINYPPQGA